MNFSHCHVAYVGALPANVCGKSLLQQHTLYVAVYTAGCHSHALPWPDVVASCAGPVVLVMHRPQEDGMHACHKPSHLKHAAYTGW